MEIENREEQKTILGYYDYTVVLTYCGMLAAFLGILMCLQQEFWTAVVCMMVAGVCDVFDGAIANTKDRNRDEKRFGIQIDSMSDLISFGVLPAVFAYMISNQNIIVGIVSALYVLCALIRLSYFNVMEENRQSASGGRRKIYYGIPVTAVAALLPMVFLVYDYELIHRPGIFPILLVLLGVGFLSPIEIHKPALAGKICVAIVGVIEAIGMFFGMGWDLV